MKIKMELLADTIFGNGISVPGGEDISLLCDENGFPYYKGGTFKGVFREELLRYFDWTGMPEKEAACETDKLLGFAGDDSMASEKVTFSDFVIPQAVKAAVLREIGSNPQQVTEAFTHLRTFTAIEKDGTVKEGSLRMARCANKGVLYEGEILCTPEQETLLKEVLPLVKWVGTMRNRGFGRVRVTAEEE